MNTNLKGGTAGRNFFIQWVTANFIGGIAAGVAAFPFAFAGLIAVAYHAATMAQLSSIAAIVLGSIWGAAQWLVLRRYLARSGWWLLASTVGALIGAPVAYYVMQTRTEDATGIAVQAALFVLGTAVGVCQWFVLRRRPWSGLWVLASAAGPALASLVVEAFGLIFVHIGGIPSVLQLLDLLLVPIAYSMVTGLALMWLLRQSTETVNPRRRAVSNLVSFVGAGCGSVMIAVLAFQALSEPNFMSTGTPTPTSVPYVAAVPHASMPGELVLTGHTDAVVIVAFSPDSKTLVSGSSDNTIMRWDVATGQPIGQPFTVGGQPGKVYGYDTRSRVFSPDGRVLAVCDPDPIKITLWDVSTGQPIGHALKGGVWDLGNMMAFSYDGKMLATGSWYAPLTLWDLSAGQLVSQTLGGRDSALTSVTFSHDGKMLVTWVLNSVTKYLRDAFDGATVSHLPSLAWGDELCVVESRNRFV